MDSSVSGNLEYECYRIMLQIEEIYLMEIQDNVFKIITRDCNTYLSEFDKVQKNQ